MKKYKIKPTKKQLKIMQSYWKLFKVAENLYWKRIGAIERLMSKKVGIQDLEFFYCDNECAGIGNTERTMKLIHREKLEK